MSPDHDARVSDDELQDQLACQLDGYLSDPKHDPEFGAVLYSSSLAEYLAKKQDDYPPDGHSYPRSRH